MCSKNIYLEPVLLKPAYFSYIWGGTLLRDALGKDIPSDDTGESWEVSAHPRGQSVIASGPAKGILLGDYAAGLDFYGPKQYAKFPLLIKFLGPSQDLSVQVHPSDGNCNPGESGKAEAWAVLACKPGAELIYGIKGTTHEFSQAVREGGVEEQLRRVAVAPGDVLDIPPGIVHALTAGIVVCEVQQNSDTTYRISDWGRVDAKTGKPRALHVEDALRVVREGGGEKTHGTAFPIPSGTRTVFIHNDFFTLERLDIDGRFEDAPTGGFAAYSVIAGKGAVKKGGRECFAVSLGQSFISPAAAGAIALEGRLSVLKAYV